MDSKQQEWIDTFNQLQQLSDELGVGDPFNYNRGREIHTAFTLGLTISDTLSGADAYEGSQPVELKSTIQSTIKATYNGISVFESWDDQEDYLINEKIGKYSTHYYTRYEGAKLAECWKLSGQDALMILLPKLKKDWNRKVTGNHKDPRLSATINKTEIYKHGTRCL